MLRASALGVAAASALFCTAAAALTPDLADLDALPLAMVRAPLAKQIEAAADKSRPLQFAVKAPLAIALADGAWDQLDAGTARWRMRVASPGAQSLNFEFAKFHLPAGAALWLYDAQAELVQGPYTAAEETPEGKLWTAVVPGEQAVLELRVPAALRDQAALELGSVGHGFRGFGKEDSAPEKSGSCNIDVACPQGDAWRSDIRSVARISVNGQFLCSGQLVNNTRQNDDPLFITANHCQIGQTQSTPASSVVFYWNYVNSSCRSASGNTDRRGNGSLAQNQTGAMLLAGDVGSDFTLLRLNNAPPPGYRVYLAGWNATGNVPQSGVAIHHPKGDEKSISLYAAPAERADSCIEGTPAACTRRVHAWGVRWSQGTTEQGSSGGGLWDENHLIVGWLSGGAASCGTPGDEDFFGRMDAAWTAGAQPDQQLKRWLAPDGGEALSLCGRNPAAGACDGSSLPTEQRGGGTTAWLILLPLSLLARYRRSRDRGAGAAIARAYFTPCMPRRSKGASSRNSKPQPTPSLAEKIQS